MVAIFSDVALRFFLNTPIKWVFEATEYALLYITFLGTAWLLKKEGHVRLDIVLNMLKPGARTWLNIISSVMLAIVCFLLAWYGTELTIDYIQRDITWIKYYTLPLWIFIIVIPVGGFLLFIQSLKRTYGYIQQLRG